MTRCFAIGLDYGTNSVRAIIVDVADGREVSAAVWNYPHGDAGIVLDARQPDLARQHPGDYLDGAAAVVTEALALAGKDKTFSASRVIGIGVDTTGSTPMPIDGHGNALTADAGLANDPDAMAWLWKDHTGHAEAAEITQLAGRFKPEYLAKCGGRYSSEWFWAKLLRAVRVAPKVLAKAHTWVEIADWIPAQLAGITEAGKIKRGICAAGHKAMFHTAWGGYPDADFLQKLHPELARIRQSLPDKCFNVADRAGGLSPEWAKKLGLPGGLPIAVGAFDAHLGAVGAGIADGTLVKIMGTSTCDIMVSPMDRAMTDIPGLCGIVPESVVPKYLGLEAGQSAVGDIFNWFVSKIQPGGKEAGSHEALTTAAGKLKPGESGLLALDWYNGNRTVLVDQRLTGLMLGMTLHTSPGEIYRALIEATAMGARAIMERFEEYGVNVKRVINCGGISARNPLAMQIYADIMNRPLAVSRTLQTCALGSAIAGAVVAGRSAGGYDGFQQAIDAMTGVQEKVYQPDKASAGVYETLYRLYKQLHDAFGIAGNKQDMSNVMKDLLSLRDEVRGAHS